MPETLAKVHVRTTINGQPMEFLVPPYLSLLDTLREEAGLTGSKEGCLDGNCGACTVIVDGRIVDSCLVLGVEVEGKQVQTVEGLATPAGLHPLQQAFLEEAALQCGICTPGFLVSAKALLDREPHANEHRIRHWLAGNLCRCTGYDKIVRAVIKAEDMTAQLSKSRNGKAAAKKPAARASAGAASRVPGRSSARGRK
jgi:carbon-monoxide dehydrogenase small subunit